jgi:hypothetical protein
MSISDISPLGLPVNLKYDNLPSIPDSVSSYTVQVAPSGLTTVSGATIDNTGSPTFVANNAGVVNQAFNSQNLDFMIPSGNNPDIYLDTRDTTLSGRMQIVMSTAPSTTGGVFNLIGSFASFFQSLQLYSNNVPIEQIYNYDLLFNNMLNSTVNQAERFGSFSIGCGCDANSNSGTDLPQSTGTWNFSFTLPLMSIIGLNLSSTSNKLLPIGNIGNMLLRMTTTPILPFATYCTAITTQPVYTVGLDSFNLNLSYVNIGEIFGSMLRGSLLDGKYFIKAATYVGANANIPSGTSGVTTLSLNIRNSSIKSLYYQFGINKTAKCTNGYFDAVNPNLISEQLNIGGLKIPQTPLNMAQRPSQVFAALQQALGGQSLKSVGGLMNRSAYCPTLNAVTGADVQCVSLATTANGLRNQSLIDTQTQTITAFGNLNYHGIDLERLSSTLFSGTNTRATGINVELNIATALTDNVTMNAWALSDCILKIDSYTKQIEVLI